MSLTYLILTDTYTRWNAVSMMSNPSLESCCRSRTPGLSHSYLTYLPLTTTSKIYSRKSTQAHSGPPAERSTESLSKAGRRHLSFVRPKSFYVLLVDLFCQLTRKSPMKPTTIIQMIRGPRDRHMSGKISFLPTSRPCQPPNLRLLFPKVLQGVLQPFPLDL